MNLTPLNDLKERLENAIFAGTSLIKDDFRLKKAYENFLPLSEVNPVFAKIKAGMDAVMASEKDSLNAAILLWMQIREFRQATPASEQAPSTSAVSRHGVALLRLPRRIHYFAMNRVAPYIPLFSGFQHEDKDE